MPEIGNSTVFSQTDGSNNTGTAPSWSGSAAPSTLDDAGRALQGAITREWNWRNYTLTAAGTADAKTLTYSVAPAAYYNGQRFAFIANTVNTGSATLNVNSLGAKTIKKLDSTGAAANLAAGDMVAGMFVEVAYNTSGDCFYWVNRSVGGPITAYPFTMATDRLLGRDTASSGVIEELSLGAGLTLSSGSLVLNGPAFSVHKNGSNQTGVTDNTETKVTWATEVFDTASCFDIATNERFTPNVAGYYLISGTIYITGTNPANIVSIIYKNGAAAYYGSAYSSDNGNGTSTVTAVISMNGSTDYVELYGLANVGSGDVTFGGGATDTYFTGCFLRGA
jgi:hypothetical protein